MPGTATRDLQSPRLRVLAGERPAHLSGLERSARGLTGPSQAAGGEGSGEFPATVLIAGPDPTARAAVQQELGRVLPERTPFAQAATLWEVLMQAPDSRMVILSGELEDVPADSLLHMLGRRHPGLPVVSLDDLPR
jgi:hypothetical protein